MILKIEHPSSVAKESKDNQNTQRLSARILAAVFEPGLLAGVEEQFGHSKIFLTQIQVGKDYVQALFFFENEILIIFQTLGVRATVLLKIWWKEHYMITHDRLLGNWSILDNLDGWKSLCKILRMECATAWGWRDQLVFSVLVISCYLLTKLEVKTSHSLAGWIYTLYKSSNNVEKKKLV